MDSSSSKKPNTMFDKLYKKVFCDKDLRMMISATESVDDNLANCVQRAIQKLPKQPLEDFYPPIIVSYSTEGRRQQENRRDVVDAGPGYVVVGCLVRFLFANGMECYSDMMTPSGWCWTGEFMRRVEKAEAMVVVLSPRFFWSVPCLEQIYRAKEKGIEIIPVRMQEHSRVEEEMWRSDDLEWYAKAKNPHNWSDTKRELERKRPMAIAALRDVATIPSRGTFLSEPEALGDLYRRLYDLLEGKSQEQLPLNGSASPLFVDGLKVVGYKSTNPFDGDMGNNREVANRLLSSLNQFFQGHNGKKPFDTHITAEPVQRNGKSVQFIEFDVGFMVQEMQDIGRRFQTVQRLLSKLSIMVGATDDELELFRIMSVVFQGSLIVLMEAPFSFFSKIRGMFQASGNHIILENSVQVKGIAQSFVVYIPGEMAQVAFKKESFSSLTSDVVSIKNPLCSLLVPTNNKAFIKLMSNGVSNWRDTDDEAWNSLATVAPLPEA